MVADVRTLFQDQDFVWGGHFRQYITRYPIQWMGELMVEIAARIANGHRVGIEYGWGILRNWDKNTPKGPPRRKEKPREKEKSKREIEDEKLAARQKELEREEREAANVGSQSQDV